jgi:hypothetical protein
MRKWKIVTLLKNSPRLMEGNRGDGGTGITTAAVLEEKHAPG